MRILLYSYVYRTELLSEVGEDGALVEIHDDTRREVRADVHEPTQVLVDQKLEVAYRLVTRSAVK